MFDSGFTVSSGFVPGTDSRDGDVSLAIVITNSYSSPDMVARKDSLRWVKDEHQAPVASTDIGNWEVV